MRQFFENKKLVVVLLSVISSLSLIAFSTFGQESLPQPMTWVNDFTAMVARLISTPTNSIMQFGDSVTNLQNTYQENQQLKKQLSTLQSLEAQNTILKEENKQMTNLLKLKPTLVGKTVIASSVISRAPENWLDKLTIDVGSNNGVKENMSVMTDSGLIGRVSEVGPTSAKVSLVTSDQEDAVEIAAGVQTDDGIFYGVIDQYDSSHNRLIVNQIPKEAKIKEGNLVTTSGLGGVSPEGLIIGKVAKMEDDEFALAKRVYVEPAANFNDIRHVFVIMSQRSEPDTETPNAAEEVPGTTPANQNGASHYAN
ncbi:rod shape-determining protein MreC [Aerococcus urinae]|uniref:rod shape-determining protein MreC n=1 Tax=Aerococcus urinae TaxID=1376 RepID=UPI0009F89BA0|nr:rod shape-determining protein MreC [Aerococcus urinae]MDL5185733.1 rod shape-determining protein MreC [Aerococcus urinae]ORE71318.1 rod shape-determining protein MreC [Aerococcus urinae]